MNNRVTATRPEGSSEVRARAERGQGPEWATLGLFAGFYAAWSAVVVMHRSIPWLASLAALALLGGFFMSLQHEALHGHPTRSRPINTALAFPPLSFWLPYLAYRSSHMVHHHTDLTDPEIDPESFYLRPELWSSAGTIRRAYILVTRTMVGRLTLGSVDSIFHYLRHELGAIRADRHVARRWAVHVPAAALLAWWMFVVVGLPVWEYLVGFVVMGQSLTLLRSFVEHCAVPEGTRSAVVKAGPLMSLLYLNNNLHHTHHAEPSTPWYALPALHRELGGDELAAEGAGLYQHGYLEVARRNFLRPFCQPDHPLSPGARPFGARGLR
ncbi:MAG TPA: fatty acid desaturase [Ilumatobacteraceae bacterium]|nr:fatty acid desaturase [Ilumatobacteraceae bacterium]